MKSFFTISFLLLIGFTLRLNGQDIPVFTIENVETTESYSAVSITSVGFSNIASGDLKLIYDPSVSQPLSVNLGKDLGGTLSFNLSNPGEIVIGWFTFPAVTLTDGAVIFNIEFEKVNSGTSPVRFDESSGDLECQFYDGSYQKLDDSPFNTFYKSGSLVFNEEVSPFTTAPNLTATENENIDVPITVKDFKKIGAVSLRLEYDSDVLTFNSASNTGGFPNLIAFNPTPGTITVSGTTGNPEGYTLADGSVIFTLNFKYHGGATELIWFDDDGTSCEYAGPQSAYILNDTPQSTYYINGSVGSENTAPEITIGEVINPVTCGANGIIPLIFTNVSDGTYTIDYDGGSFSNVIVSSGSATISAPAGNYNNLQITVNEKTSALGVQVVLTDPELPDQPVITAGGPTSFCEGGSVVLSSTEAVSYEWSTGENTQSITVLSSGSYYVTVSNAEGCSATSETVEVTVDSRPEEPAKENCWDEFVFNNTTCQWENVGVEPVEPTAVNCWDEYVFDTNSCEWQNIGAKPEQPVIACYEIAIWNETSCSWDVTGTQPESPATACWEIATWNETTCTWDLTGSQPAMPNPENCWDEFVFNNTTCQWENVGVEPVEPTAVNCWDEYVFDTNSCEWQNIGAKPEQPVIACYEIAIWNETSCSWDVTGTQPESPATACWEIASWNETTCVWDVTGSQPAMPNPENCWDEFVFNNTTCQWENFGAKPVEPNKVNVWDEFMFDPDSCVWKNIGIATNAGMYNHPVEIIRSFYPNPFTGKATLNYTLPQRGKVNIYATGILGNRIVLANNLHQTAGEYFLNVDGSSLIAGMYQITLRYSNLTGQEITSTVRIIKR